MAPYSSTLAWKIPWREEPGGLQPMGSVRVRYDWATSLSLFTFMHWRRKWQPTPVFLPGESEGWGSLVGCRLWGHTVGHNWSDLAEAAAAVTWIYFCGLQEKIGSVWPPRGQPCSSDLLCDEAKLWRMGGRLSGSTWHLQAGPSASLQLSVLSLSSPPQAAAVLPWKKIHQEENGARGSESAWGVTGARHVGHICCEPSSCSEFANTTPDWWPGLCCLISRMWPAGSLKNRDCHSAGYDLASLPTASVGQNVVQLPQSNCKKRPRNARFMCAKKGERPVSYILYSTAAHPNPTHLIPLPHFASIFLSHSSSSWHIERVTGRKAKGLPTEEIGCKCQTFFISLLSGRRKQTSVKFFSPSLY